MAKAERDPSRKCASISYRQNGSVTQFRTPFCWTVREEGRLMRVEVGVGVGVEVEVEPWKKSCGSSQHVKTRFIV